MRPGTVMQPTPGNITRDYEEERGRAKKEKCERRAAIKKGQKDGGKKRQHTRVENQFAV